jgi:hypothetical protein
MNRDDIIKMAQEAGIDEPESDWMYWAAMERFAALVAAAPRQWVELTDDEARALVNRVTFGDRTNWQALVYKVDAKLKEKNT